MSQGRNRVFEKTLVAGWGDMDFNSHMRNTAFLDKSADVRMMFFAENGFPMEEFMRRKIGPVIMKDEVEYFKEVRLLEPLRVTLTNAGLAEDGSRFLIRNEFWRGDGKLLARVTSTGGWLDLATRKLITPPEGLLAALRSLTPTEDFQVLTSSIKANSA
jgi:acyl-CoA thioester hydrolase